MRCFHVSKIERPLTGVESISLAEGVGFEPTVGCPTLDFESSALNRTQPPFPFTINYAPKRRYYEMQWRVCKWGGAVGSGTVSNCTTTEPFRRLGMTELKMSQLKACQQAFSHCILYVRWTVPLLLVVRCNSQVISGAVHDYSPLFTT